ncbi:alpha/beta hydrolase [Methylobacterium sp. C25]|uniref:alpha/beta hydrolase n=1 Tax=Methylobacterium sp. C25 TaxID=2721622 RepID=UPI001F3EB5F1|nr:alpha/beta fold hydrolase [Methylobacterium sp. C25]MCE4225440.1 alpha/beta hydrolase [Methylobacterium sp. C25]
MLKSGPRILAAAAAAITGCVLLGMTPCRSLAQSGPSGIVTEEMMVPATDEGISLYVRNKHPAGISKFRPERTLLFVHGSTYPAETSFDLPLAGRSWMDEIAAKGYDVYLVDLRGYGRSTRPPEMSQAPEANGPIVRTETAVKDVGSAVDAILKRRGLAKLDLMGWSWGTTIMASYTTQHPDKVSRLVLYAPQWIRTTPSPMATGSGPLGAYRSVTKQTAHERWLTGVPHDKVDSLIPAGWFEQWAAATFATDPIGAKAEPAVIRAPNGTVADAKDYWSSNKPVYDPAKIVVPTLLVGAEWDRDCPAYMRQALFPLLVNAPGKRYIELAEGTHTILMEKNRLELFRAVQTFLDEGGGS